MVDICGPNDLDLNSSRTQIIMSDKWLKFEESLSFEIFSQVANLVTPEYWEQLKKVLTNNTKNDIFISGLNRVVINGAV